MTCSGLASRGKTISFSHPCSPSGQPTSVCFTPNHSTQTHVAHTARRVRPSAIEKTGGIIPISMANDKVRACDSGGLDAVIYWYKVCMLKGSHRSASGLIGQSVSQLPEPLLADNITHCGNSSPLITQQPVKVQSRQRRGVAQQGQRMKEIGQV